jgi:hypothetical protein
MAEQVECASPHPHPLALNVGAPATTLCNVCRRGGETFASANAPLRPFSRCTAGCDFDLCAPCFSWHADEVGPTFAVTVNSMTGQTYVVEGLRPRHTVAALVRKLEALMGGVTIGRYLRLLQVGRRLHPESPLLLEDLRIAEGTTLHVVIGCGNSGVMRIVLAGEPGGQPSAFYVRFAELLEGRLSAPDADLTVGDLKCRILALHGYPIAAQRLAFGGAALRDELSLASYGITPVDSLEGLTLYLDMVRDPEGGP